MEIKEGLELNNTATSAITPDTTLKELQLLRDRIISAASPQALFGELEGANTEKLAALNTKYFKLAKQCGVSNELTDPKAIDLSREAFEALSELYRSAQESIRHDGYGDATAITKAATDETVLAVVQAGQNVYSLRELLAEGDVAMVYRASYEDEKGVAHKVCVKIAKNTADNELIANEQKILAKLKHVSLPQLIEEFELPDGRAATALSFAEGYNFHQLRDMPIHSNGLKDPDYHIGWILERQLSVLGYLHSCGIVHGSVEPAHLIVQPQTHNVVLIDFCWAVKNPTEKKHIKIAQEFYSAPEVYAKEKPHPGMDIYGLGKSAIYLVGGDPGMSDLPDSIDRMYGKFLERMKEESTEIRANDAYQLARHLLVIRDEVSGQNRGFSPLPTKEASAEENSQDV